MGRRANERDATEQLAPRFRRWLDTPDSLPSIVPDLLALPDRELGAFLRLHEESDIRRALAVLIERSHRMLATAPREAVTVSRLATRVCSSYFSTESRSATALRGDVWKEHAAALLSAADYVEADDACARAGSF